MDLVISDANILIDLAYLDLLDEFFTLSFKMYTTSEVVKELDNDLIQKLDKHQIRIIEISDKIVDKSARLTFSKSFSFADVTLLTVTYLNDYILLSGERLMVKWCKSNGLEVHGIIYIVDQFVIQGVCSEELAISKLESLMEYNTWLPFDICMEYIEKWKK